MFTNRSDQGVAECERTLALNRNIGGLTSLLEPPRIFVGRAEDAEAHNATICIQAFVMNVFGSLDNLALIWVGERSFNFGKMQVGLGPKCKAVRSSFSQEMQRYLSGLDPWFDHIIDFRDALAHRYRSIYRPMSCRMKTMPRTERSNSARL
jgi:hypothetical protein